MQLKQVCNPAVITAKRRDTINRIAELMREYHVGAVVIADPIGNKMTPVGLITDRDIVIEVIAKGLSPEALTAEDLVTGSLVVANIEDDIENVVSLMHDKQVRRLPVVDSQGCLFGIVALDDLLQFVVSELQALSSVPRGQVFQEVERRA